MKMLPLLLLVLATAAQAQIAPGATKTIDGFWQSTHLGGQARILVD